MRNERACDHALVGVIARDEQGRILLIERKKFPVGWAPPSGHLDGCTYSVACFNEFEEGTGLKVVGAPKPVIPKNPRKYFKCQRGGRYHDWQIFEVNWRGELKLNEDETKNARWCSREEIEMLAVKTAAYIEKVRQAKLLQEELCQAMLKNVELSWQIDPGLEPVWCEFFKELRVL